MKLNKNMIWVIVGLIVLVLLFQPGEKTDKKLASADVTNADITRSFSAALVKAGDTFTTTYTAADYGAGSWGVLIEDDVTGGCTPSIIDTGFLSPTTYLDIVVTAPGSAGSCTFSGTYVFAGSTDKTIVGSNLINICEDACTLGSTGCVDSDTRWECVSGTCNVQNNVDCISPATCSGGVCSVDCAALKTDALNAITAWAISPTVGTKQTALDAILAWASNC